VRSLSRKEMPLGPTHEISTVYVGSTCRTSEWVAFGMKSQANGVIAGMTSQAESDMDGVENHTEGGLDPMEN
jgi:hypothetical protein